MRESGSHPNICTLKETFEKRGGYYLVIDLISGGEMYDHLAKNGTYSEADAARSAREMASALAFLHGAGLVHADLKPGQWCRLYHYYLFCSSDQCFAALFIDNLMLSTSNKVDSAIKLVDFGCTEAYKGNRVNYKQIRDMTYNTPAYSPPEAFSKHQGPVQPSFDMWGMGCILYIMLVGRHPFDHSGKATDEDIVEAIKNGAPSLRNSPYTQHLSEPAIDLLERLMDSRPCKRITAAQMLEHQWIKEQTSTRVLSFSRHFN